MDIDTLQHLISTFFLWSYKIAILILGYLFAKLGHDLFLKGVKGEFKFRGELKGAKADLASASPGLFFILMGAIIVGIGLYKGMTIEPVLGTSPCPEISKDQLPKPNSDKPKLPRKLPETTN